MSKTAVCLQFFCCTAPVQQKKVQKSSNGKFKSYIVKSVRHRVCHTAFSRQQLDEILSNFFNAWNACRKRLVEVIFKNLEIIVEKIAKNTIF